MTASISLNTLQLLLLIRAHGSISAAAHSMNLSQSAASRKVAGLEQQLNTKLTEKAGRGIKLTNQGESLCSRIINPLTEIQSSLNQLRIGESGEMLIRLASPPTLGATLLIPLLADLRKTRSDILVSLESRIGSFDLNRTHFDMAIMRTKDIAPDCTGFAFLEERFTPVCHRELAGIPIEEQSHLQLASRLDLWDYYLHNSSVQYGSHFEHYPMLIQAAANQLGAILLPQFLLEDALKYNPLIPIGEAKTLPDSNYQLVVLKKALYRPSIIVVIKSLCPMAKI